MKPDTSAMRAHVDALFRDAPEGLIELAYISPDRKVRAQLFDVGRVDDLVAQAVEWNRDRNVYIGATLKEANTAPFARTLDADAWAAWALWVDLDDDGAAERAQSLVGSLRPTLTVTTGRTPHVRQHLWYRLEEPITDMGAVRAQVAALAAALGGDPTVCNVGRIMRLAGSVAWPTKPGRIPELVEIETGGPIYSAAMIAHAFPPVAQRDLLVGAKSTTSPPSSPLVAGSLGVLPAPVEDGREQYMRDTVFAVLLELTGTTGAWPTVEEVFDAARPQLVARIDLSRSGRISAETFDDELATKCRAIVERAHRGALEGARTLEEAVAAYQDKWREHPRHGPENRPEEAAAFAFTATEFVLRDPATIPRREWMYGRHLIRRFLSVTVAPGGVGKSTLIIGDALALATGKPLLGASVWEGPKRVWIWNLEDPRDEIERRIWAAVQHHHLLGVTGDPSFAKRLFIDSGRDQGLCIARQLRGSGVEVIEPVIEALVAELRRREVDVLYVDPFVSSHAADENDNRAIDAVAKAWGRVADQANCAIELVHHARKLGGASVTQEAARGASALVAAARSTRVLNAMTKDEAANAGLRSERGYFSALDDKRNLAPATAREWFRLVNVDLANGDAVAAVEAWAWPDAFDGLSTSDLVRVQAAIEGRDLAENCQSADWAGYEVARVLRIDASAPEGKARVKQLLRTWISTGALVVASARNPATRKQRFVVRVGASAEQFAA
jgi:hypothetical protein